MNVRVTERCEKSCKSQNGEGHNDGCKENKIIHVQRLKSVKLYNNPMDETKAAEMKSNDEDPKGRPTGVAPPQQPKASTQLGLQRNCQAAQRSHLKL
jgi:hypothetical protein